MLGILDEVEIVDLVEQLRGSNFLIQLATDLCQLHSRQLRNGGNIFMGSTLLNLGF